MNGCEKNSHKATRFIDDSTGRLVRQSVLNGSKKRIYDAEYGYDMNNNVSKLTSSAGGVSMTEKFDYGKDNLASKHTYLPAKTE